MSASHSSGKSVTSFASTLGQLGVDSKANKNLPDNMVFVTGVVKECESVVAFKQELAKANQELSVPEYVNFTAQKVQNVASFMQNYHQLLTDELNNAVPADDYEEAMRKISMLKNNELSQRVDNYLKANQENDYHPVKVSRSMQVIADILLQLKQKIQNNPIPELGAEYKKTQESLSIVRRLMLKYIVLIEQTRFTMVNCHYDSLESGAGNTHTPIK